MPGSTEIPDLIIQLMRDLNRRGMRTQASPELGQYVRNAQSGLPPPGMEKIPPPANVHDIAGGMAPTSSRPPPISRDPWFDDYLEPSSGIRPNEPPLSIDEVRGLGRPATPGGFAGDIPSFLWVVKNGKRTRIDGPFIDDISAARAMREMRDAAKANGISLEFEIGPDFDPR